MVQEKNNEIIFNTMQEQDSGNALECKNDWSRSEFNLLLWILLIAFLGIAAFLFFLTTFVN